MDSCHELSKKYFDVKICSGLFDMDGDTETEDEAGEAMRKMWCSVLGAGPRVVATVCTAMVVSLVVRALMEPAQADILKVALQRLRMERREGL